MSILAGSPLVAVDRVFPYENRYLAYVCRLMRYLDTPIGSGSTWGMHEMLRGAPDKIGPLPFTPLSLDRSEFVARATRHLWEALSESMTAYGREPYRYYAEKTFGDSVEFLAAAGIQVKLINLIRDPRDVVTSIRAFDSKRHSYGFGRTADQSEGAYLTALVVDMKSLLERMHVRARIHDHVWVRYEDLVLDRSGVIAKLSHWLALDLPVDVAPSGREYRRHRTTGNPRESVGKWRQVLSDSEVVYIDEVLGDEMTRLGYALS